MSSISAMHLGLQGIQKGMDGLRRNAHEIASANTLNNPQSANAAPSVNDVTDALIGLQQNRLQAEASTKVVKTSLDMIGNLLDEMA